MRGSILMLTACAAMTVSGCSQVSGWLKGDDHKASHRSETTLRTTPDQSYQFSDAGYDIELYDTSTAQTAFSGYDVILYEGASTQTHTQMISMASSDPRDSAFVKLNGTSDNSDWRNCETLSSGYLFISEYDFSLQPEFEVCMRNKGYVLVSEAGSYAVNPISAQTAGLRGYSQPAVVQPRYSYP